MIQFIKNIMSHPLGVALVLLPLSILAKNLIGAGGSVLKETFNIDYLKRGLFKGFLIYMGIGVVAFIAFIAPDISLEVDGTKVTLVAGMITIIMGSTLYYLYETFKLLNVIFKQKSVEGDSNNE